MNQTPTLVLINFTYPILAAAPTVFFLSIQVLVHISLLVHHKHGAMQIYFTKKPFMTVEFKHFHTETELKN